MKLTQRTEMKQHPEDAEKVNPESGRQLAISIGIVFLTA